MPKSLWYQRLEQTLGVTKTRKVFKDDCTFQIYCNMLRNRLKAADFAKLLAMKASGSPATHIKKFVAGHLDRFELESAEHQVAVELYRYDH